MLTIYESAKRGVNRRELLRIGTLGLGGLSLPQLLAAQAHANGGMVKDKAIVMLNLQGGPTHIETFDPKMTAPVEYRSINGEVKTSIPGVTIGAQFPKLAKLANRMAFVRSFAHNVSSHGPAAELVASGGNITKAAMSSLYARVVGTSHPQTGVPSNVVVPPLAAGPEYKGLEYDPTKRVTGVGTLPAHYRAFDPSVGSQLLDDMKLQLPQSRFGDRRVLLSGLDQIKRRLGENGTIDGVGRFQQQAFDVLLGGVSDAFDVSQEDPQTIARYDTGHIRFSKATAASASYIANSQPIALGKQLLLARRLVEAGCGYVTVTSNNWDWHGPKHSVPIMLPVQGAAVDHAVSAFLEDLEDRGLSEKVLFILTGEFGRTPRINSRGGRDHWGNLCTLALAGGGLQMGQVIGESDRLASRPASDPVSLDNLLATVMDTLFDRGLVRISQDRVPTNIANAIVAGEPIRQLG